MQHTVEEKSLLDSACDDLVGVGLVTELMDEHADNIDDGDPCLVKMREGVLENGGCWTLE